MLFATSTSMAGSDSFLSLKNNLNPSKNYHLSHHLNLFRHLPIIFQGLLLRDNFVLFPSPNPLVVLLPSTILLPNRTYQFYFRFHFPKFSVFTPLSDCQSVNSAVFSPNLQRVLSSFIQRCKSLNRSLF